MTGIPVDRDEGVFIKRGNPSVALNTLYGISTQRLIRESKLE